jgi:hypothetical protein
LDVQIIVPIGCSVLSAGCAVFVAWRASRWRESDEAKAITRRIDVLEKMSEKVAGTPALVDAQDTALTKLDGRVAAIEHEISELPTKADIRGLDEQLKGLAREQGLTHASVNRIEDHFIKRGIGATA